MLVFIGIGFTRSYQLDLEDALFLTKNTIKELKQQLRHGDEFQDAIANRKSILTTFDLDYPFNNVMNSVFPIDSLIELNVSRKIDEVDDVVETLQIIGRYASFSPLINDELIGNYVIFPNNACEAINASDYSLFENKILVVLRGGCTFVQKVSNIINSELNPTSIIIGNDEPYRSLITMYSNTFNEDGSLRIPIMFITNEDYKLLRDFESDNYLLLISTASLDNWINLLISMALSPPILIVMFYLGIKFLQSFRRKRINRLNEKIVKKLPVYIFNDNHLIPSNNFYEYLTLTNQANSLPDITDSSSSNNLVNSKTSSVISSLDNFWINGFDLKSPQAKSLHILTAPDDYYATFKCSICLDKFKPLQSRVIVLECKHIYHEKCLSNWLVNFKRSCPLCNTVLNSNGTYDMSPSYGSINDDMESDLGSDLEAQFHESVHDLSSSRDSLYAPTQSTPLLLAIPPLLSTPPLLATTLHSPHTPPIPDTLSSNEFPTASVYYSPNSYKSPKSLVSDSSTSSFVTAHSRPGPSKYAGTSFKYARPLQILSQYSAGGSDSQAALSSSIDSALEEFATPAGSINDSQEDGDDTIDGSDQTPDVSSVSTIEQAQS